MSYIIRQRAITSKVVGEGKQRCKVSYNSSTGVKSVVPIILPKDEVYSVYATSTLGNVTSLMYETKDFLKARSQAHLLLKKCSDVSLIQIFCRGAEVYSVCPSR